MKLGNGNHLMYCLNIHPGESLEEVTSAIRQYATAVKAAVCPDEPFALGLRLSRLAAGELLPKVGDFRAFLADNGFYAVTINGFPYGQFHGRRVKEDVYLPDWSGPERTAYTLDLARILAGLLPEGEIGTISTVPCHYGKQVRPEAVDSLLSMADELSRIERETGKRIILALEPEPDCLLDSEDSTLDFFEMLFDRGACAKQYIGVCLDCCHAAVVFESPKRWFRQFSIAGIAVPKIQVSASLKIDVSQHTTAQHPESLKPFCDDVYLHQTRVRAKGKPMQFPDLPDAIAQAPDGEWRVHFHVPLNWGAPPVQSTADLLEDCFLREVLSAGAKHLEVETYSFSVVPGPKPPLVDSIIAELQWLKHRLA
jgi:hypothetical protein